MSCRFFPERTLRLLLVAAFAACVASVHAAPQAVLPFGAETWNDLSRAPGRPLAVVFSASDCTHCPGAIDSLADAIRRAGSKRRLVVVVIDGAGQEAALLADRHYRRADALYAFASNAAALRYRVNPDWRGLTPYVALIPARGAARFHAGLPSPAALRAFLDD